MAGSFANPGTATMRRGCAWPARRSCNRPSPAAARPRHGCGRARPAAGSRTCRTASAGPDHSGAYRPAGRHPAGSVGRSPLYDRALHLRRLAKRVSPSVRAALALSHGMDLAFRGGGHAPIRACSGSRGSAWRRRRSRRIVDGANGPCSRTRVSRLAPAPRHGARQDRAARRSG